jgi:DNA polymerase gamma 1
MDCITPSHSTAIPPGESLDISQLLDRGAEAFLDPSIVPESPMADLESIPYTPRVPVMDSLNDLAATDLSFLQAQITGDDAELKDILKKQKKPSTMGDGASTMRKRTSRKELPYSSQAQLIPHIYQPFESTKFTKQQLDGSASRWVWERLPARTSRNASHRL